MFSRRKKELKEEWKLKVDSSIVSSPIASAIDKNGKPLIIFGTKNGKLYAIDDNSKIRWFYSIKQQLDKLQQFFVDESEGNSIYAKPLLYDINHDGRKEIIFGSVSGALVCLNHDGNELWRFNAKGKILATPLAYEEGKEVMLVIPTTLGKLIWLNSEGKKIEERSYDAGIESTPNTFLENKKRRFVFGTNAGEVICLEDNKETKWKFKTHGKITARPIISDLGHKNKNFIIVGSHDGNLYCIDSKGNLRWKFKTEDKIVSEVALADFNNDGIPEIVFCSYDSGVYALNAEGNLLWNYKTDFWIEDAPIIADIDNDGKMEVVVGSYDHSLYVLDAQGSFFLNYIPGVSLITNQVGQFGSLLTHDPAEYKGKKLFTQDMGGIIIGTDLLVDKKKNKWIVVAVKDGKIAKLSIKRK